MSSLSPQVPSVSADGSLLRVSNDFFEIVHDGRRGGCPCSLVFRNGSGRNFLERPLGGHVAVKTEAGAVFHRQHLGPVTVFESQATPKGPLLVCEGRLQDENGAYAPVKYRQTSLYGAWGSVEVSLRFEFEKKLDSVLEIGVCDFHVSRGVDILGVRPGCPPPPPDAYYHDPESWLEWHDLEYLGRRSYTRQYSLMRRLIPSYFCLFEKGVEGLEFWREDVGDAWDRPFGVVPGHSAFLDDSRKGDGVRHIRVEPFCDWGEPLSFGPGRLVFNYRLGLPFGETEVGGQTQCVPYRLQLASMAGGAADQGVGGRRRERAAVA